MTVISSINLAAILILAGSPGASKSSRPFVSNSPPGQPSVHTGMSVMRNRSPCAPLPAGKHWRDGQNRFRTLTDLRSLLANHNLWAWTFSSGERADLSNAELCGADLHDLNLRSANLSRAKLAGANLYHADLMQAVLTYADLSSVDLRFASFTQSNLRGANLSFANPQGAFIQQSDMQDVSFFQADLRGANVQGSNLSKSFFWRANCASTVFSADNFTDAILQATELSGSDFSGSNMEGTVFEPSSLPQIRGMATTTNLEKLTFRESPDALAQLRKQFQDGGFVAQERKTTYALRHTDSQKKRIEALHTTWECPPLRSFLSKGQLADLRKTYGPDPYARPSCLYASIASDWIDYHFDQIAFDWTCHYGMDPNRCWKLFSWVLLVNAFIYFVFMHTPARFSSGVYLIEPRGNDSGQVVKTRLGITPFQTGGRSRYLRRLWELLKQEPKLVYFAFFFSLMSAFNIGFREINFGRWLRMLTIREYDLKAQGVVRPIAGLQALFSVAMLALWLLTYFGRPFSQ